MLTIPTPNQLLPQQTNATSNQMLRVPDYDDPQSAKKPLNTQREIQYLMPPGMKPRSGSIMRRRSSVRKKSTSVTFNLDFPIERRGSFRASVKRRMSISRRSITSRKLSKSDSSSPERMQNTHHRLTWKSRALGEKNYQALKKLAIVLQDKRDVKKKEIDFQTWSKKQQEKQKALSTTDQVAVSSEEGKARTYLLGKRRVDNHLVKDGNKDKLVKLFFNGVFLTTGVSLLAAVLVVITYTSFVQNDPMTVNYHHHHQQQQQQQHFSTLRRRQQNTLGFLSMHADHQKISRIGLGKNFWKFAAKTSTSPRDVLDSSVPVADSNASVVAIGDVLKSKKSPCVGVPMTLGDNPLVISMLCSSSSSSSSLSLTSSSNSSSPPAMLKAYQ